MKKIYIFGKSNCPVCKEIQNKVHYFKEKKKFDAEIKYFDMETVSGLTEGAMHEVSDVPTIIIFDQDKELVRWARTPPISKEFLPYFA